jgi:hypothetical protein
VSEHAMLRQLELHSNLQKVILCLDHDEAGIEADGRFKNILAEKGYTDTTILQSTWKDWNEDLKALHGIPPKPASEHPKLVLLPKVCEGLSDLCEAFAPQKDMRAFLVDYAQKLESLTASGKVTPENTGTAIDCLECMTAGSLLLLKDLCRQMERPVTAEQLVRRLQSEYKPHEDRGWLRSKMEDIRHDMADIGRQIDTPGIRSKDDMKRLCRSYLSLALDCVKAQMFVELESPELVLEQGQAVNFLMSM